MKKKQANELTASNAAAWPEWSVFALFAAAFIVVSIFHEPWFDEAESWQIAKCASIRDILFLLPHYEGHPPLWHLLLAIPAKLGVPYEIGLKTVAAIPTFISVWLILFRSPFPRPVRLLLPFNYFVFYQYGIVSRPYGLMLLATILSAMSFYDKDEKPWRFVLSLLFLCLCSAYGIILAGGICICWVLDILKEYGWRLPGAIWKDRRVHALFILLLAALLLIAEIVPYPDTYATTLDNETPLLLRLIYTLFMMLPECLLTSSIPEDCYLPCLELPTEIYVLVGSFGIVIWCVIYLYLEPENRKYYFIPAALLAAFMSLLYASSHHIGIISVLLLMILWVNGKPSSTIKNLLERAKLSEQDKSALKLLRNIFITLVLLMPAFWTLSASVHDIQHPYYHSRETAEFLKESGLSELRIMCCWREDFPDDVDASDEDAYQYICANFQYNAMNVSAYFSGNISYTFNGQSDECTYVFHRRETAEENKLILSKWREAGAPDVLLGKVDLELVFGDDVTLDDYAPVYQMKSTAVSIWKDSYLGPDEYNYNYIYLRKDLLDDYGLTPLSVDPFLFG